ncbi:glycosyltransferase family 4 protein [Yersinia sp. 1252 StPb PI]|uniref:glycosyltransferase family 4 protein n=1 Tax=Yersinia sp. 1252 StPb PI TaxID=3117404 RepID=UPI003B28B76B
MSKILLYVVNADWYFKLHWYNRAQANIASGYEVKVISSFSTMGIKEELEEIGIECFDIKLSRSGINPFFEIMTFYSILKVASLLKPDIIHSITVKPNIYSGIIGRIIHRPVVKSVTGLGVIFSNDSIFFRSIRPLITNLYKLAGSSKRGAFVFENHHDLSFFKKNKITNSQSMYFVEGAGVDPNIFSYDENIFGKPKMKLLFGARLLKDKGLDTLIMALDALYKERDDFELSIAGIYDLRSRNSLAKQEIEDICSRPFVQWLGRRNDMDVVIKENDLVVLPTRYGEGIPRILIEAAFCGRPVLTTNVPGCNEFIENGVNGYLVEPANVDALKRMLSHIFDNQDEAKIFSAKLYDKVKYDYSDSSIIAKFQKIYCNLQQDSHL